ncbi:mutS protein homolog 4-like, partial [Physella acuta]|uniref:mutS protein homolog 4-like n=1 Tax=Physella acuta TaxID=109671 RepID=UPI0027DD9DE9
MIQKPKYQFGLLQTPSDAEARGDDSSSSIYPSKTPSTGERLSPASTPVIRRNSSLPQRTPASTSSSRTPRVRSASNTPYTTSSTVSIDHYSSSIAALVEGRGHARGEVGITSLDLKESVLVLSQFSDSQTYTKTLAKLHHINPMEILLPNTLCESGANSKLFSLLTNHFPNVTKSAVQRRYYNEAKGLFYIKNLCASEYHSIELQISNKYYCLATTGALLKYVEFIQNIIFAPKSLKAVYRGCEHTTMIDTTTVRNLELLQNLKNPMSQHTLFGVLNHTKTPGGGRLLRSNILQPPNDEETIRLRQDAVMELTEKEEVFFNLQRVISKFVDIGHVVSMCVQIPKTESVKTAESKLNCVIVLKHVLELVEPLKETLSYCENQLLQIYCKALTDARYDIILDKLKSVIREETHLQKGLLQQRTEKCFAVRPQINGLLDVARRTYSELVDDIHAIVQQLSETHKLALRTAYSSLRGFHIQMTAERGNSKYSSDSLPPVFIKVTKFKNTLSFTTMDVIQQNERIKIALDEIYMMSNIIVSELLGSVHEHIGCLYQLSDIVSMVDLILSFAHAATVSSYVCPEFTDT